MKNHYPEYENQPNFKNRQRATVAISAQAMYKRAVKRGYSTLQITRKGTSEPQQTISPLLVWSFYKITSGADIEKLEYSLIDDKAPEIVWLR